MLHVVASTGRTATSFIAECFDRLPGVAACHEGHRRNDDGPDLLPLINLENFSVFRDPASGAKVVAAKRSADVIAAALEDAGCEVIVDGAYYNAILGPAILEAHDASRMVAIVRDCESFVRSVTWLEGTDPMPVGWPDAAKELSTRERFISMGRIRPTTGPDAEAWPSWGPIERNIWLWQATNRVLCDAKDRWPDRVAVVDFGIVRSEGIVALLRQILVGLGLGHDAILEALPAAADEATARINERSGGYQIDGHASWTPLQQEMLTTATSEIQGRLRTWTT